MSRIVDFLVHSLKCQDKTFYACHYQSKYEILNLNFMKNYFSKKIFYINKKDKITPNKHMIRNTLIYNCPIMPHYNALSHPPNPPTVSRSHPPMPSLPLTEYK